MLDTNGNLTEDAKKFLSPEEAEIFDALPKTGSTWIMERQATAATLISAAMQRRALLDIEERADRTTRRANLIAALAAFAVFLQVVVEIAHWVTESKVDSVSIP